MKTTLIATITVLLATGCQPKASKAERVIELNGEVKKEQDYQQQLGRQLTGNDSSDRYLFEQKERSDRREDSLLNEIKKIESE